VSRGLGLVFATLLLLTGCGGARATPPSADEAQRAFPDMGGRAVMLLPVQGAVPSISVPASADPARAPVPLTAEMRAALESELGYWLAEAAPRVRWVLPAAIERAANQSRTLDVHVRDLTVRDFQRARLQTIGDPLYGELRKVSVLVDARPALLPIGALWIPEKDGLGRVHLALALIDTFGGDVLWYGVVAGSPAAADDPSSVASTAQALARLVPR
jgi:hypothetical protein